MTDTNDNPTHVRMERLHDRIEDCTQCDLCHSRTNIVFGEGDVETDVMVVGEAPGRTEDEEGRPFIGRSGRLLTELLERAGLERDNLYITNVVKCRPPNNRNPSSDEMESCSNYMRGQIHLIRPESIIAAGKVASNRMIGTDETMRYLLDNGPHVHRHYDDIEVIPIYHPSYILRQDDDKRKRTISKATIQRIKRSAP